VPIINQGLLGAGALANTFSSALRGFRDQKRYNDELDRQKRRDDLEERKLQQAESQQGLLNQFRAKESGLIPISDAEKEDITQSQQQGFIGPQQEPDPYMSMGYKQDPFVKKKKQMEIKSAELAFDEKDPSSDVSRNAIANAKQSLAAAGMNPNIIPDSASASDVKGLLKDVLDYKQSVQSKRMEYTSQKNNPAYQMDIAAGKKITEKISTKVAVAQQIDSNLKDWDSMNDEDKLATGQKMLKILNSTEGQDAVGKEEAERLAAKLSFAFGNFTNNNPTQFGRDLEGFKRQANQTSTFLKRAAKEGQKTVEQITGQKSRLVVPDYVEELVNPGIPKEKWEALSDEAKSLLIQNYKPQEMKSKSLPIRAAGEAYGRF
jgi:hypothetical protein